MSDAVKDWNASRPDHPTRHHSPLPVFALIPTAALPLQSAAVFIHSLLHLPITPSPKPSTLLECRPGFSELLAACLAARGTPAAQQSQSFHLPGIAFIAQRARDTVSGRTVIQRAEQLL